MLHGAVNANLSKDMHHIVKITKSEHLKMEQSNWLALCVECHEALEKDELEGMKTKQWSDLHYEEALNART
jgi:5-methylcytosine-specific restriction endonuclease McrA